MIDSRISGYRFESKFPVLLFVIGFATLAACNSPTPVQGTNSMQAPAAAILFPAATPSQVPGSSFDQLQWATVQPILQSNCASCHGSANGAGGVSNITEINQLVSSGLVIPGDPNNSRLYQVVESGVMPPTDPLPSGAVQTLYNWILNGFSLSPSPSPSPTPSLSPSPSPSASIPPIMTTSVMPTLTTAMEPAPSPSVASSSPVTSPSPGATAMPERVVTERFTPAQMAALEPARGGTAAPEPGSTPAPTPSAGSMSPDNPGYGQSYCPYPNHW